MIPPRPRSRFSALACASLLGLVASLRAQEPAQDALSYALELDVDLAQRRISGVVHYRIRALAELKALRLDAEQGPDYRVAFTTEDGAALPATWTEDAVVLELPAPAAVGTEIAFDALLEGSPPDGFYFAQSRYGELLAFTDHYSVRAHGWLPCIDDPADRARFCLTLSYPEDLQAVASGVRPETGPEVDPRPGRRVLRAETVTDIPPYMFAIGVGPWVPIEEPGDARLRPHLVYRRDAERARPALVHHAAWLKAMESAFGPYAFGKYLVFQCPTRWGGFEAPGNVQIHEQLFELPDRGVSVLAHELVHMWFGDGVGYAEWRDVWLSEGFASYFGPWLHSQVGGPPLQQSLRQMRARWRAAPECRTQSILWDGFAHPDQALNVNTYQKAAWVLHMLRGELGDEAFSAALRAYYTRRVGTAVRTSDFIADVEKSSRRDLQWFFAQWLERPDGPHLRIATTPAGIAIEQTQNGMPYRLRIPIRWTDRQGAPIDRVVEMRERRVEVDLQGGKPETVVLDPDVELLFSPAR